MENSSKKSQINLDTFPKLNILIDLSYLRKFEGTISEYETFIHRRKGDPETREVFKALKEEKILIPTAKKYSFQLFRLDIKALCHLIERQNFIIKVNKYMNFIH
jgi:hypothetical protein